MSAALLLALTACGPVGSDRGGRDREPPTCPADSAEPTPTSSTGLPTPTTPATASTDTGTPGPPPCRLDWAVHLGSTSVDDLTGAVVAPDGTLVVAGWFAREMTFGEGQPNETTLTPQCGGSDNPFLAKYQPDGTLLWAVRAATGCDYVRITALDVDPGGDLVAAGWYADDAVFGEGLPTETELPPADANRGDLFLARYDGDGTFAWVTPLVGPSVYEEAYDVSVAADGTIYAAGQYEVALTLGGGTPSEVTLAGPPLDSPGETELELWLAAYDPAGAALWAVTAGGKDEHHYAEGVAALAGRVVVTGNAGGDMTFGAGGPNEVTVPVPSGLGPNTPVAAYDAESGLAWAQAAGGASARDATPVDTASFLLVGGAGMEAQAVFGAGTPAETVLEPNVFYLARHDADGGLLWVRGAVAGPNLGWSTGLFAASSPSSVAVAGRFSNEIAFDGGPTFWAPPPAPAVFDDELEAFAATFTPDGDLLCAWSMTGPDDQLATVIAVEDDGSVLVGGTFRGTITLEAGTPEEVMFTAMNSSVDLFVARFLP